MPAPNHQAMLFLQRILLHHRTLQSVHWENEITAFFGQKRYYFSRLQDANWVLKISEASRTGGRQGINQTSSICIAETKPYDRLSFPSQMLSPNVAIKALANKDTLLWTNCCWHKRNICCWHKFCFGTQKVFLILFRNILCAYQHSF